MPWVRVGTVSSPVIFARNAQGTVPAVAGLSSGYWQPPNTVRFFPPQKPRTFQVPFNILDHTVTYVLTEGGQGRLYIEVPNANVGEFLFLEIRLNDIVMLRFDGEYSGELSCVMEGSVQAGDVVTYVCIQNQHTVPISWVAEPAALPPGQSGIPVEG
jgi:hypothetical protein